MTPWQQPVRRQRSDPEARTSLVLDTATRLFTAHGVHAVGMDRLIAETGLAKMSVYRLYPTKDELVGAYLERLAKQIFGYIDADIERFADRPAGALLAILDAIEADLRRSDFRGCSFGNAASEFDQSHHPAREVARTYRTRLLDRLIAVSSQVDPEAGTSLGRRLAVLIDGAYLSAAHLGWDGPASEGLALARELIWATESESPMSRTPLGG